MDDPLVIDYKQLIKDELEEWRKLGVGDPASIINSNTFIDSCKLMALTRVLVAKGILDDEELEVAFQKQMFSALQEARKGFHEVRRSQITKGILN